MDELNNIKKIKNIDTSIAEGVILLQQALLKKQTNKIRNLIFIGFISCNCFIIALIVTVLRLDLFKNNGDALYVRPSEINGLAICCIIFLFCFILFLLLFILSCYFQLRKLRVDLASLMKQEIEDAYSGIIAKNEELSEANRLLLDEIKANNEKIELKQKHICQLSHELRTPLTAITHTLTSAEKSIDIENMKIYLCKISEASKHMLNIINDTLEISKLDSGEVSLVHSVFSVKNIFGNISRMFSCASENKGIEFSTEVSATIPEYIYGDKLKVTQVLINLISNAMKYTDCGGKVTLTAECGDRTNENVLIKFVIKDTGIGIPTEKLGMIFDEYKQIDNQQGTGLGLSISRRIAHLMHGDLRVRSSFGNGSEFIFTALFAIADQSKIQNESRKRLSDFKLTNKKVLIVEDVEINAEMSGLLFSTAGMEVIYAQHGKKAIEIWNERHSEIDLIMMDIYMPVMNGLKAAKAIRISHKPNSRSVPIIALGGDSSEEEKQCCFDAGMDGFLQKPATESTVSNIISEYVCIDEYIN